MRRELRRALLGALAALAAALAAAPAAAQTVEPRVVGGQGTTIEEWPWQVAIADPPSTGGNGYDRQFCGGSLIGERVVLTAAHCAFGSSTFRAPSNFSVITGRTTLSSSAGAEIPVIDVVYPVDGGGGTPVPESQIPAGSGDELYNPNTEEWDVVVLELASTAPAPAAPIAIASASEATLWEPGDPAWVTGWGDTVQGGTGSDTLQEAQVEIVSDADCGSAAAYGSDFDPVTMVCAGIWPEGGKDTCQGDSGGPLVVPTGAPGEFRLVGDTSWGVGCALPSKPGVYGRVADDPMRSAIADLAAFAVANPPHGLASPPPPSPDGGGAPPPGGDGNPVDSRSPETTITKRPRNRTTRRRATFGFSSDEAGSSFECKLDRKAYKPCEPPYRVRVRAGRHRLKVRALDAAGNLDSTPATDRWRVRRR